MPLPTRRTCSAVGACPRRYGRDALLIVDELVTNAVRHTGSPVGSGESIGSPAPAPGRTAVRRCGLTLEARPGHLVISVCDETDQFPVLRDLSLDAESGRGRLQLVAGLCDGDWGCAALSSRPGKLVWAQLPIGPFPEAEQPPARSGQKPVHHPRRPAAQSTGVVA